MCRYHFALMKLKTGLSHLEFLLYNKSEGTWSWSCVSVCVIVFICYTQHVKTMFIIVCINLDIEIAKCNESDTSQCAYANYLMMIQSCSGVSWSGSWWRSIWVTCEILTLSILVNKIDNFIGRRFISDCIQLHLSIIRLSHTLLA